MRCIISEYKVINVDFKDQQTLVESLVEMGYKPKIHKNAQPLYGYQGDEREQKAHIILPRSQVGGSSNDVGFERTKTGFQLHASQYDSPWRTGQKIQQLRQTYSEKRVMKTITRGSKYRLKDRKVHKDGKIKLRISTVR